MSTRESRSIRWSCILLVLTSFFLLTACGTFEVNIAMQASPTAQHDNDSGQLNSTQIITQIVTPLSEPEITFERLNLIRRFKSK